MLDKLYDSPKFREDVESLTTRIRAIPDQNKRSSAFNMLDNIRDLVIEIDKSHEPLSGFLHNLKVLSEQKEMLAQLRTGLDLYIKDATNS